MTTAQTTTAIAVINLPGLVGYYEQLAEFYVNWYARRREDRQAKREHERCGPVTFYVPYSNGVYVVQNHKRRPIGFAERVGECWVPTEAPHAIADLLTE